MNKYGGVAVVMPNDIIKEHNLSKSQMRSLFLKNQRNLIINKDYYKLSHSETMKLSFKGVGGYPQGIILYTQSGYNKIMGENSHTDFEKNNFQTVRPQMVTPKPQSEYNAAILDVLTADREAYMSIIRTQSGQIDTLIKLLGKLMKTPMELPEFKEKVSAAEWYSEINGLADAIHRVNKQDKTVILSTAYKTLDSKYGLCIDQYRKEYGEIVHKKPTVLDTIYWVENEKNPNTKGLLSGILQSMLDALQN